MPKNTINLIWGVGSTNVAVFKAEQPGGALDGFSKTVAIVSPPGAPGIVKALELGFPEDHIHLFSLAEKTGPQLRRIFGLYDFDFYHMMGFYPVIPKSVIEQYKGYNQHMGPGGKWMDGAYRMYAQMRFNQEIHEDLPVPIFMQEVVPDVDGGDVIYVEYHSFIIGETAGEAQDRLKKGHEWNVNIEGRRRLATGTATIQPVPRVYRTLVEKELMDEIRHEAHACFQACEEEALSYRCMLKT